MVASLTDLEQLANLTLEPERYRDYCPNGLQVEGRPEVARLISGVTACQSLLDAAVAGRADAVLVHHGFFWRDENPVVRGMKRRRIATLINNDISLLAYHLPLDDHPQYGNNAALARLLDIEVEGALDPWEAGSVGNVGRFAETLTAGQLVERVAERLGRQPLHVGDPGQPLRSVAWCTGGAQGYIERAVAAGVDVFITGEVSEQTVHIAREEGIQFIAAGHHATERYGVQALGSFLAENLGIEHQFVDVDNPA
jgi:dinuclear metal center YbgI/SA1388 family protein